MTTVISTKPDRPSIAIVQRVATLEGIEATELPPLYEVVDSDALDALVNSASPSSNLQIEFQYYGHDVTLTSNGVIHLKTDTANEKVA